MENQVPGGEQKKSFGPLIGTIIIIVILILGAFYIWGGKLANNTSEAPEIENSQLVPLTQSDTIEDIEADLTAEEVTEVDFSDIEAELQ